MNDPKPPTLNEVIMQHLLDVLEKHNGNKVLTALELGISLRTVYNRLNAHAAASAKRKAA